VSHYPYGCAANEACPCTAASISPHITHTPHPHPHAQPTPTCSRLHAEGSETGLPSHVLPAEVRLCSKLELLDRLLVKLRAGGHKVRGLEAGRRGTRQAGPGALKVGLWVVVWHAELPGLSSLPTHTLPAYPHITHPCTHSPRSPQVLLFCTKKIGACHEHFNPAPPPLPPCTPHHAPVSCPQVLLFCTMTRALDVISDYLDWRGFPHLRMDGNTPAAERGELVSTFNDPGGWSRVRGWLGWLGWTTPAYKRWGFLWGRPGRLLGRWGPVAFGGST